MSLDGERELLQQFQQALESPNPITIPRQTLLGAVSHFISVLPVSDLDRFWSIVSDSTHLWDTAGHRKSSRDAVRIGILGAITRSQAEPGPSRWWNVNRRSAVSIWLDEMARQTLASQARGRDDMLIALLLAVSEHNGGIWRGNQQAEVEDESIMLLAKMDLSMGRGCDLEDTEVFCELSQLLPVDKLRVLDLQTAVPAIVHTLIASIKQDATISPPSSPSPPPYTLPPLMSRTLARLVGVMHEGDEAMQLQLDTAMLNFCRHVRGVSMNVALHQHDSAHGMFGPLVTISMSFLHEGIRELMKPVFDQQKTALFAFLLPASAMLDVLLGCSVPSRQHSARADLDIPASSRMALEVLHTLSTFASVLDATQGGVEGYHRVLHGMMDVLAGAGGVSAVTLLFKRAPVPHMITASPAEAAWWMRLGEGLIREVDRESIDRVLRPVIDKYIIDDTHRSAFEAAHSLRLATLRATADSRSQIDNQSSVANSSLSASVEHYGRLLVEQRLAEKITHDEIRAAFPVVAQIAARVSAATFDSVLGVLQGPPASKSHSAAFEQTRRMILISCAPYVPNHALQRYLDDIAAEIAGSAIDSSSRSELAGAAFKMVMQDLRDSARGFGMRWWIDWRDVLRATGTVPPARM